MFTAAPFLPDPASAARIWLAHSAGCGQPGEDAARRRAHSLFDQALGSPWLAWLRRLWSRVCKTVRPALRSLPAGCHAACLNRHYVGLRTVPICSICGSEGRTCDFDAYFRPLHGSSRERWVSVAAARLRGIRLPPVELIAVGANYYVRDGHHRISVARALGEEFVEASVTVW